MASDSLLDVIAGLVKRDGETKKEEKKLAREKLKAEKLKAEQEDEEEPEEDEDEAPVGDEEEPEAEPEDEPLPPEEEPEDDGVDPVLVDKVVQKVVGHLEKIMQKVQDKSDAEKFRKGEAKMSGKKEKVNTKPKLEQVRKGRMNFREAIRMSVTGTNLSEGYEEVVLGILQDEDIDGPLGYEPFFEKGKLFVEKGSEREAKKALQQSKDINKLPKIVGEELEAEEYLQMEAVIVDGRLKGFKEALKRLTYEKLKKMKEKENKEEVEFEEEGEYTSYWMPEGLSKEGAAEFMAAASAAKRDGKKKFKFGDKEYPVTIKVDIPLKKEEAEVDEGKMSADAKRKQKQKRATPAGKKSAKKSAKKAAKYFKATGKTARDPAAAAKKARKARANSFVPGGSMIEKWKEAAFDKIRAIRSKLSEGIDATAARELKLYIEHDRDLYRQQIVPIIKNVQRKMKSGKYDHAQAPKLWLYLVDNGAKKYVKEFGGDDKRDFPKDLRLSIANEFAIEYKAEIDIQGGDML